MTSMDLLAAALCADERRGTAEVELAAARQSAARMLEAARADGDRIVSSVRSTALAIEEESRTRVAELEATARERLTAIERLVTEMSQFVNDTAGDLRMGRDPAVAKMADRFQFELTARSESFDVGDAPFGGTVDDAIRHPVTALRQRDPRRRRGLQAGPRAAPVVRRRRRCAPDRRRADRRVLRRRDEGIRQPVLRDRGDRIPARYRRAAARASRPGDNPPQRRAPRLRVVRPDVSVIIACYNGGDVIGETLDHLAVHVLAENIIVVSDRSTDDTAAVARSRELRCA